MVTITRADFSDPALGLFMGTVALASLSPGHDELKSMRTDPRTPTAPS
ncbi:hypothetical protein LL946_00005 [Knoellia locipacati]